MKAIFLPFDLAKDSQDIEAPTLMTLCDIAGIECPETVRTPQMQARHQVVIVVEDDGHQRGLPINYRAQALSAYPGPIVGNVLVMTETEDPLEGRDLVGLPDGKFDEIIVQMRLDELVRDMVVANPVD